MPTKAEARVIAPAGRKKITIGKGRYVRYSPEDPSKIALFSNGRRTDIDLNTPRGREIFKPVEPILRRKGFGDDFQKAFKQPYSQFIRGVSSTSDIYGPVDTRGTSGIGDDLIARGDPRAPNTTAPREAREAHAAAGGTVLGGNDRETAEAELGSYAQYLLDNYQSDVDYIRQVLGYDLTALHDGYQAQIGVINNLRQRVTEDADYSLDKLQDDYYDGLNDLRKDFVGTSRRLGVDIRSSALRRQAAFEDAGLQNSSLAKITTPHYDRLLNRQRRQGLAEGLDEGRQDLQEGLEEGTERVERGTFRQLQDLQHQRGQLDSKYANLVDQTKIDAEGNIIKAAQGPASQLFGRVLAETDSFEAAQAAVAGYDREIAAAQERELDLRSNNRTYNPVQNQPYSRDAYYQLRRRTDREDSLRKNRSSNTNQDYG